MGLKLPENYTGEDKVEDYTKLVKKIWDNVIPQNYPNVLKFDTEFAKWIEHKRTMGPYHMWENKLYVQVKLLLSPQPFIDNGWDGKSTPTQEDFIKAYPNEFFTEIRNEMRELAKFVGLNVSNLDMEDSFLPEVNFE